MRIDFHCHVVGGKDWYADRTWKEFIRLSRAGGSSAARDEASLIDEICDPDGKKLLRAMAEAQLDRAVIFPSSDYDLHESIGCAALSIERRNAWCFRMAEDRPDSFIPFVSIDPRRPGAVEFFREGLDRHGAKGLKLLPGAGFFPQDRAAYPLYELATQRGVPVLLHTGPQVAPMKSKFADPLNVDEVAADFPDLPLVMAHCGFAYWPLAASIAQNKPNVYLEISAWQTYRVRDPDHFYRSLRTIVNLITSKRVLFGTDTPFVNRVLSHADFVAALTNPPAAQRDVGLALAPHEADDILGGNAATLLGLA